MGPYCRYCQHRCFVPRILPSDATWRPNEQIIMATCPKGMENDLKGTGYTCDTATNPYDREDG